MAASYKHKRYFRCRTAEHRSVVTFSSTSDANTKIGFKSVFNTSSPTKTEALADSGQTLVVTYEFNSDSDQTAFKNAVDGAWGDSTSPFSPATDTTAYDGEASFTPPYYVEHFKTEWLNQDGSVSATMNRTDFGVL